MDTPFKPRTDGESHAQSRGIMGLGLRPAALVLTAAMLVLLAAHYFTNINGTLLFWIAFILTRPWGAVVGKHLEQEPRSRRTGVG